VSAAVSPPGGGTRLVSLRRRRGGGTAIGALEATLLLIPALIPVVGLSIVPLARGIYLGFTDAHAGFDVQTHWIGIDNFTRLIHDSFFTNAFKIGFIWSLSVTGIQFVLALGLALLLNTDLKGRWIARSLALVPWAMPPVVVGIMWKLFYQPQAGLLDEGLRRTHLPGQHIDWLSDFKWALPAVILVGIWAGMPQTTVALLAGLQGIAGELHEAAAVDGATTWQRFLHVTLPQLKPVILAITSIDFIWNFNSFGIVYVLTQGGPGTKTQLPMLFAYNAAFKYGEFGYAAALGDAMVVVFAFVLWVYLLGRVGRAITLSARASRGRPRPASTRRWPSTSSSLPSRCSGCSRFRSRGRASSSPFIRRSSRTTRRSPTTTRPSTSTTSCTAPTTA
jgi:multiple sugar transport system permease protein